MAGSLRQGRKGAAQKLAAGSARPDSKARPVNVERLRAVVGQREMTEAEAERWLDHLYALADVTVQAFKEQQSRVAEFSAAAEPAVAGYLPASTASAVQ